MNLTTRPKTFPSIAGLQMRVIESSRTTTLRRKSKKKTIYLKILSRASRTISKRNKDLRILTTWQVLAAESRVTPKIFL
jgi:hypothetical protein